MEQVVVVVGGGGWVVGGGGWVVGGGGAVVGGGGCVVGGGAAVVGAFVDGGGVPWEAVVGVPPFVPPVAGGAAPFGPPVVGCGVAGAALNDGADGFVADWEVGGITLCPLGPTTYQTLWNPSPLAWPAVWSPTKR